MIKRGIDWRSLVTGLLLGLGIVLMASQYEKASGQTCRCQIVTSKSTWVIDTSTGDVWQIYGFYDENDPGSFKWYYAGNPSTKESGPKDSPPKPSCK